MVVKTAWHSPSSFSLLIHTTCIANNIISGITTSVVWISLRLIVVAPIVVVHPSVQYFIVSVAMVTTDRDAPRLAALVKPIKACCVVIRAFVVRTMNVNLGDWEDHIWYEKRMTLE